MQKLPNSSREKIVAAAEVFNLVCGKVDEFLYAGVPLNAWYIVFSS